MPFIAKNFRAVLVLRALWDADQNGGLMMTQAIDAVNSWIDDHEEFGNRHPSVRITNRNQFNRVYSDLDGAGLVAKDGDRSPYFLTDTGREAVADLYSGDDYRFWSCEENRINEPLWAPA